MPGILDSLARRDEVQNRLDDMIAQDAARQQAMLARKEMPPALLNMPLAWQLSQALAGDHDIVRGATQLQRAPAAPTPAPYPPKGGGVLRGGLEGILDALVGSAYAGGPPQGVLGPMVGPQLPAQPLGRYINGTLAQESVPDLIRRLKGEPPELTRVRTPPVLVGGVRG